MMHSAVIQRCYVTLLWKVGAVNTQSVDRTRHLWSDRRPVSFKLALLVDARPPARATTIAARRLTGRPTDKAAQLAYSEWLLTKLTA